MGNRPKMVLSKQQLPCKQLTYASNPSPGKLKGNSQLPMHGCRGHRTFPSSIENVFRPFGLDAREQLVERRWEQTAADERGDRRGVAEAAEPLGRVAVGPARDVAALAGRLIQEGVVARGQRQVGQVLFEVAGPEKAVTAPRAEAPGLQTVPPHSHLVTSEGFAGPGARY